MDNQELKDKFKLRISIYEIKKQNDLTKKEKRRFLYKKTIAACACLVLISGIVFAKEIQTFISQKIKVINTPDDEGYAFYKDMEQEKGIYYNPIKIFEGFDEETANIEITFEGAFEFDTYKNRFMREIKKHE